MMPILDAIVQRTRSDVAQRRRTRPLASPGRGPLEPTRSLSAALSRPGLRFLLEVKQRSPSAGVLRPDFDPVRIAEAYRPVADAISVLTDGPFFHGSFEHLRLVRRQVSQPILCKDFIVDPYQVLEARAAGADAILLMLSILDDAEYRECAGVAARLGLEVLTEVHTEAEVDRAIALDAGIIGINNRDLATMTVTLETTRRLAPRVPPGRLVVSESGIRSRRDVDGLAAFAHAFLVGSELMKAPDPGRAARALAFGAVKICGLTRAEDARAAYECGATFGGLVFAPESPRAVTPERAVAIARAAPLAWCGVFVDQPADLVVGIARGLALHAVQLHGHEGPEFIAELRPRLPEGCEVWKAVAVQGSIPELEATGADRLLLDGHDPARRGGTGRRFDWNLLRHLPDRPRLVLAGGITPGNVREAHGHGCAVLDVSSGVEASPGIKDAGRLHELFDALRRLL